MRNSLFAGSDHAAKDLWCLFSTTLITTCRLHDIDPEAWPVLVLIALREGHRDLEALMPW